MRLVPAILSAAFVLAGCGGGSDGSTATGPSTAATTTTETHAAPTQLRVYFVRDEAVGAAGLVTAIPAGTTLRDLSIADGVATVDLSRAFNEGGGSASMQLRVAQVVYTLTHFATVERVRFRIEGGPVAVIGGEGVIVDPPVDRADFEDQTPPILVESPTPGETISSPLQVSGTANTFEATLNLRVLDGGGKVLYDSFATATSGSGTRGTFDVPIEFAVAADGPGALVAYERSAEDGSEIHIVRIPVTLRR